MNIFMKGFMLAESVLIIALFAIAVFKADHKRAQKAKRVQRELARSVSRQRAADAAKRHP